MSAEQAMNYAELLQYCGNSEAMIQKIFMVFLQQAEEMPVQIKDLVKEGDFDAAKKVTHSFKGSAKTLFAEPLAEACQNLENALLTDDKTAIAARLSDLLNANTALLDQIRTKLASF